MMDKKEIEELKMVFVTREECDDITSKFTEKLSKYGIDMAEVKTSLNIIKWLLMTTVGGIIALFLQNMVM